MSELRLKSKTLRIFSSKRQDLFVLSYIYFITIYLGVSACAPNASNFAQISNIRMTRKVRYTMRASAIRYRCTYVYLPKYQMNNLDK